MKKQINLNMPPLGPEHAKQSIDLGQNKVNNPVTKEMATQQITDVVNNSGMPPQMFAEMGQLAEKAIHNKKKYKDFVDYMVKHKLEKAEDLKKPDYQMLASLVVIGKVASTMGAGEPSTTQLQPIAPEQGM